MRRRMPWPRKRPETQSSNLYHHIVSLKEKQPKALGNSRQTKGRDRPRHLLRAKSLKIYIFIYAQGAFSRDFQKKNLLYLQTSTISHLVSTFIAAPYK